MKRTVIYPLSADPLTLGHIDIIKRIEKLFPTYNIDIIIANNRDKNHMFSIDERLAIVKSSLDAEQIRDNINIISYSGFISEYANNKNISIMVRGLRNSQDLNYEFNLEQFTRNTSNMETIYLSPFTEHLNTSSSLVRMFLKSDNIDKAEQFMKPEGFKVVKQFLEKR